jgi:ribulose 1,5-bisphosphate carboxylase large subunit-like protein
MRQAVDATLYGKTLEEYAKNHQELAVALKQWKPNS